MTSLLQWSRVLRVCGTFNAEISAQRSIENYNRGDDNNFHLQARSELRNFSLYNNQTWNLSFIKFFDDYFQLTTNEFM